MPLANGRGGPLPQQQQPMQMQGGARPQSVVRPMQPMQQPPMQQQPMQVQAPPAQQPNPWEDPIDEQNPWADPGEWGDPEPVPQQQYAAPMGRGQAAPGAGRGAPPPGAGRAGAPAMGRGAAPPGANFNNYFGGAAPAAAGGGRPQGQKAKLTEQDFQVRISRAREHWHFAHALCVS